MSFKSLILVNAVAFNSGKVDKNGEAPVLLNVLAGKAPNRTVISGTIAKRSGFELGKMYIAQVTEGEPATYTKSNGEIVTGRQFNINKISEVEVSQMFGAIAGLGEAQIFEVEGTTNEAEVPEEISLENKA